MNSRIFNEEDSNERIALLKKIFEEKFLACVDGSNYQRVYQTKITAVPGQEEKYQRLFTYNIKTQFEINVQIRARFSEFVRAFIEYFILFRYVKLQKSVESKESARFILIVQKFLSKLILSVDAAENRAAFSNYIETTEAMASEKVRKGRPVKMIDHVMMLRALKK